MIVLVIAALLSGATASTDCATSTTDAERSACLLQELQAADTRINTSYARLRATLPEADRVDLRDAQRAWIKRRDAVCRLTAAPESRAAWLGEIARDYAKTVCVVRFTTGRATTLESRIATASAAPSTAPQPALGFAEQAGGTYDIAALVPRITGKWYFEAAVRIGDIARANEQALFVGVRSATESTGTLLTIHRRDAVREPVNIGVAVDLDAGKLYLRENGAWRNGGPGGSAGQDLKLGRAYQGWISSSAALDASLASHSLEPNFGARAFVYALPEGYRPLNPDATAGR